MKICIPSIGSKILLSENWSFYAYPEGRNETLFRHLGLRWPKDWKEEEEMMKKPEKVTLPAGTELRIDRIYIRKGLDGFDSVTFFLCGQKTKKETEIKTAHHWHTDKVGGKWKKGDEYRYEYVKPARAVRFWAKLADVNGMDIMGQVLE